MPRKSAKMVRRGHYVGLPGGRETRVVATRRIESEKFGELVEIELATGAVWRRTPASKIHVTRLR